MLPIKTILCPADFSEPSQQAYRAACVTARRYSARIIVVHVLPEPRYVYCEFGTGAMDWEFVEREVCESLRAIYPPDRRIAVEHRVCRGPAAAEILVLARTQKADLIVMGTHGRTGIRRLLLGSVAEAVLRRAPCPVLTVREPVPAATSAAPAVTESAHA
jgi:nucleotide-binding universal stress UspA family protein